MTKKTEKQKTEDNAVREKEGKQGTPETLVTENKKLENEQQRSRDEAEKLQEELMRKRTECEKLKKELQESRDEAGRLKEELIRKAAEFENFRRQKEKEVQMAGTRALEKTIKELLPVIDDVNRLVEHAPEVLDISDDARPYVDGVELLRKNLFRWLEEKGVSTIDAVGKKMDVNFHEAITMVENPDVEADTVIEEFQAGYLLGEKVLRHAKVVVAR